jgi:hypothetical protein
MNTVSAAHQGLRPAIRYSTLTLLLSVAPTVQALAVGPGMSISDKYDGDTNTILSTSNSNPLILIVNEDYNEQTVIPYLSHDGSALVNSSLQYFDKVVTYRGAVSGVLSSIEFNVSNSTSLKWSDYHLEFWNSDFTSKITGLSVGYGNDQFANSDYTNGVISFYAPGSHDQAETGQYWISTDLYNINGVNGSFGIRQVATSTPEPGSMALIGVGMMALLKYRRFSRAHTVADNA